MILNKKINIYIFGSHIYRDSKINVCFWNSIYKTNDKRISLLLEDQHGIFKYRLQKGTNTVVLYYGGK